jgi:hypothetical protein
MRFLGIVFQIHFLMSVGGLFEIPGDAQLEQSFGWVGELHYIDTVSSGWLIL